MRDDDNNNDDDDDNNEFSCTGVYLNLFIHWWIFSLSIRSYGLCNFLWRERSMYFVQIVHMLCLTDLQNEAECVIFSRLLG